MLSKPLLRANALVLTGMIGMLTSGVPSHHHDEVGPGPVLESADHHGHVVQLVDQSDRLTSDAGSMAVLPSATVFQVDFGSIEVIDLVVPSSLPILGGRAPPPARPRAPPVSA